MNSVSDLVKRFGLEPHPEGGFFKETYRAAGKFGERIFSTAIYFLLPEGKFSALHRIKSDEMWHFYLGGPLLVTEITSKGELIETRLGQNIAAGERLQYLVPAGNWFGARPITGAGYSLVGCTVSPGFDFADFEMGQRDELKRLFPQHQSIIDTLT